MDAGPSSFFDAVNLKPLQEKLQADTDLRGYCEKLAAVMSIHAIDSGQSVRDLQVAIIEDLLFDPNDQNEANVQAYAGRCFTEEEFAALTQSYNTPILALYLLACTPFLANWTDLYVVMGDQIEETAEAQPMRIPVTGGQTQVKVA